MKRLLLLTALFVPVTVGAQATTPQETYERATVTGVAPDTATLTVLSGTDANSVVKIERNGPTELQTGDTIVVRRVVQGDGTVYFSPQEQYRVPSLIILTLLFFGLGIVLGGRIGFTSLLGLAASIGVLMIIVIPGIVAGGNPLTISLLGAVIIACTSLYLAHGFNRRTSLALLSTVITLVLATILAVTFVYFGKLFGMGSEEAMFLQSGLLPKVNLRGLLLGGIIIGALGVLDDITTAQTAAIDELSKANTKLGFTELYAAGTSIGREHIASLINTLALAYVGASLPMLLLFFANEDMPWWVIINSEFVAEEIVRTLVGSATLLLAVPIATFIAAKAFAHGNHTKATGHAHVH